MYSLARNKPYWIVLISGLLLAAAFPPSPLWPLAFVAFVPLFVLNESIPERVFEDKVFFPIKVFFVLLWQLLFLIPRVLYKIITERVAHTKEKGSFRLIGVTRKIVTRHTQMFRYYYMTFLIWNALTCYWLSFTALGAFTFDEALMNFSSGFLAVTLNPLLMFIPLMILFRIRTPRQNPVVSALMFIPLWITFEFLHLRWDLSWSWVTLGHSLSGAPFMIQYLEFTGILGASFHILLANVLIYAVYRAFTQQQGKNKFVWMGAAFTWIMLPVFLLPFILNPDREVFQSTGEVRVRVIQPNIDPFQKFEVKNREEQIRIFCKLMKAGNTDSIGLFLFPETALPRSSVRTDLRSDRINQPIWQILDSTKVPLLTGFTEIRLFEDSAKVPTSAHKSRDGFWYDHCNAAIILQPDGSVSPSYQKSKLVPMVERTPFMDQLTFLKDYNIDLGGGFSSYGLPDSMILMQVNDSLRIGMMICYESEFGDFVRRQTKMGANLLTIITNDGWWGNTSGYIQHAGFSVLRAIENRRSIARSANTGRSLFCDAKGHISGSTKWWTETYTEENVKLYEAKTFYVEYGDWLGYFCLILSFTFISYKLVKKYAFKS